MSIRNNKQLSQSDPNPKKYIIQRNTNNRKRNCVATSSYNNLRLTRSTSWAVHTCIYMYIEYNTKMNKVT